MKIKNKKRMNLLVALFAVVLMTGSAFAFVSNGALFFEGIANVNADLRLEIEQVAFFDQDSIWATPAGLTRLPDEAVSWVVDPNGRSMTFTMDFDQPGYFRSITTSIENTGTMDAQIVDHTITSRIVPGSGLINNQPWEVFLQENGLVEADILEFFHMRWGAGTSPNNVIDGPTQGMPGTGHYNNNLTEDGQINGWIVNAPGGSNPFIRIWSQMGLNTPDDGLGIHQMSISVEFTKSFGYTLPTN